MLLEEITDDTPLIVPVLMNLLKKGKKVGFYYTANDTGKHFMGTIFAANVRTGRFGKELEILYKQHGSTQSAGYYFDRLDDCADLAQNDGEFELIISGDHSE